MRILTVRQPWAWAIIHGGKTVENRSTNIAGDYRGPVLIHAAIGKTATLNERQERLLLDADEDGRGGIGDWLDGEPIVGGVILGVVDLVDVHRAEGNENGITADMIRGDGRYALNGSCSPWAEANTHHLVLANPRPLSELIRYRGALGLRRLDDDMITRINQGLS
ncbi:ASCH domain-containing protein [Microbacterium sp. R1]|uniref:Transcription factor n=1 Tax=Microbacterium phage vB_MoxS-R1 TaxID=2848881 RepID=A0A8F2IVF4_9CAUD|nr:ASCH domain-containing protein [Microbacterium sp. R1]YP_010649904.1 transcription factor [Microbacterium phage vB_MoxS-R1]MBE7953597.1 ASCH domain-containing protein [Microbacterium sp. R1]QWT28874.1 transcription factor [Microbacterium phage vB_MoxS-R1]